MLPNYVTISLSANRDIPGTVDSDATYESFSTSFQFRDDTDNLNRIMEKFELLLVAIGFELGNRQLTLSRKEYDRTNLEAFPSANSPE